MTAVPVRIPNEWSADWFRRFYNEVLASGSALAAHDASATAHPTLPAFKVGMVYLSVNTDSPATVLGYGEWNEYGTGTLFINDDAAFPVYVWQRSA